MKAASDRPAPLPILRVDERFVEVLAEAVAAVVVRRLDLPTGASEPADEFLDTDAAARHISADRRRIHDLNSARLLRPDGYDGRRPLYRRSSLDRYVEGGGGR